MAAATHQRKKQFQAPITSFFSRDADPSRPLRRACAASPALDEDTQANLISVGMRIRKSVPEGYKTHKTMGALGGIGPYPSSAPALSTAPSLPRGHSPAELMPFCGLHKIGGWATQSPPQLPSSSAPTFGIFEDDDETPELSHSQTTLFSSQGSFLAESSHNPMVRKRGYEDDVEDDLDAWFDEFENGGHAVKTASMMDAVRPIARMRSSQRKPATTQYDGHDQHLILDGSDFEEASFLAPMEGVEEEL